MKKAALILLGLGVIGIAAYLLWKWMTEEKAKEFVEEAEYGMVIPPEVEESGLKGIYSAIVTEAESKQLLKIAEQYPIEEYAIEAYERGEPYEPIQQQEILKRVATRTFTPVSMPKTTTEEVMTLAERKAWEAFGYGGYP